MNKTTQAYMWCRHILGRKKLCGFTRPRRHSWWGRSSSTINMWAFNFSIKHNSGLLIQLCRHASDYCLKITLSNSPDESLLFLVVKESAFPLHGIIRLCVWDTRYCGFHFLLVRCPESYSVYRWEASRLEATMIVQLNLAKTCVYLF